MILGSPRVSVDDDFIIRQAINEIYSVYGDVVSVEDKKKSILKFGSSSQVQTTKTTIMTLPSGTYNETYLTSNLITTVSSSSASDTQVINIEGHTISGGVFTFVTQQATLNGTTQVTLGTALARISRIRHAELTTTNLVGTVYGYENDTTTAGVPNTAAKVHIMINAGLNTSEKAATTISDNDYFIITNFYGDCLEKVATWGLIHLEIRKAGGVFINQVDRASNDTSPANFGPRPYLIVPKNADVRIRALASSNNKSFTGGFDGFLASIQ